MHFKCLELVGFKSFAEKTVIGFEPGITAIVGPNGCGKSNVSDAIRWVLGEQNARNLRGSLMEDLIFGGSSEMEAMGMAEVSLTLGNARTLTEDRDDEVTVSRRLFRSGESQYFFNKQPCRLKDIQKVFMDTGLGTKAYSYIQQGNIDLILSSRPEDRRFLFDETAGITKYKADKKEAIRKLDATENNLLRLSDLVREVKRQMISIQRQAGKARRYKDVADELQTLDVGFLLHKRVLAAEQKEALEKKRQQAEALLRHLTQEIEAREARTREVRAELQSSSLKHEELQSRKLDLLRSIDREAGNISLCKQRIADTQTLQDNTVHEIKTMRQKTASLESAIRERQDSLDALKCERAQCGDKLKEKEAALDAAAAELRRCETEVSELSNRLLGAIRREIETRGKATSTGEKSAENERALAEVRRGKKEILRCLAEKEKAREASSKDKETLSEQVRQEKERLVALRAEMKETDEALAVLRKEILEVEGALSRLNSERHFLTEAVEQYEGYDAGVRDVIEESKREDSRLKGVIGTVADLIDVPSGEERVAEAALDTRLQWVVTETIDDARRAAAFLAQRSRGRATFLPLEAIQEASAAPRNERNAVPQMSSLYQPALGLVSTAPEYEAVVRYLLGDVVIVENLDRALELAGSEPHLTIVTTSGERIRKGAIITAGKTSTTAPSLISRKSRIAAIVLEEQDCRQRLSDLREKERELLAVQRNLEEKSEDQMAAISGAGDRVVEAERSLLDLSTAIDSLRNRAHELTARQTQTESDQERLESLRKTLAEELRSACEEKAEVEKAIAGARAKLERVQKEVASHKENAAEVSVVRFSFDERIANLQSDTEYMRGQLDLTQKELEARQQQIEQGKVTTRNLEKQIEECDAATVSLNKQKDEVTASIEQFDEGRKVLADELSQVEWEIKEKSRAVREREKETADLNIALTEVRFSINNVDEHLMTEYGLSPDDPKAVPLPDGTDWEEVQAKIADLKRKLQSLGPVNLCAIEEYEALKERHDFLVSQQSDLIEAKDALLKAIAKLDRESKTLFRETFERVREEFQKMFQRLFGGGRADLFLIDESNLLESGIEIIARPPGKKLQAISLLSGGERAMTAISLLFAIFKVKPSPFCILDEIDAPLDDSNIVRFAEVLREFTENSQFIVITHNKRTISASDILYGITMEESGKSKVVSARLTRGKEGTSPRRAEVPSVFSGKETALVTA
ncbi:MAG: chromosome segregation protein SMC [bacterium]|nr:chromosome segregation protein SMC [bacterium]